MDPVIESSFLDGKVRKRSLPVFQNPALSSAAPLKRLLLPQGELAQVHNGEPAFQYLAVIELKAGTERGNHFHQVKEESIYVLQGELTLLLENTISKARAQVPLVQGDLAFIAPYIAHTLRVSASGVAIEFSPTSFDGNDIFRYAVTG